MIPLACVFLFLGTLLSAFYTALELAVVSANRLRLHHLLKEKVRGASTVANMVKNQETYLAASQIGITLSNSFVAILATFIARKLGILESDLLKVLVFFFASVLFLFWAELLPKTLVRSAPTMFLLYMAKLIVWSRIIFSPLLLIVQVAAKRYASENLSKQRLSRQQIRTLFSSHAGKEVVSAPESNMAHKLFSFNHVTMRQVLKPRKNVVCIAQNTPVASVLETSHNSGVTRIPVFEKENGPFLGLINVFDLLYKDKLPETLTPFIRETPVVDIEEPAYKALAKFQSTPHRMAFVADRTGAHAGIVTVEDLVEQILGEIHDEFD